MIELNFLQICKDGKIVFETVTNIRSKMEGISGWKNKSDGSLKTKVKYITSCKLR